MSRTKLTACVAIDAQGYRLGVALYIGENSDGLFAPIAFLPVLSLHAVDGLKIFCHISNLPLLSTLHLGRASGSCHRKIENLSGNKRVSRGTHNHKTSVHYLHLTGTGSCGKGRIQDDEYAREVVACSPVTGWELSKLRRPTAFSFKVCSFELDQPRITTTRIGQE